MMWIDTPPFRGVFVVRTGDVQSVKLLPEHGTFLEALADVDEMRKNCDGLDFIQNGNGFSILPSKIRPPAEQRRK